MSALEERTGDLPLMTEEEFERWCDEDTRAEYVDGKVIVVPTMTLTLYHARCGIRNHRMRPRYNRVGSIRMSDTRPRVLTVLLPADLVRRMEEAVAGGRFPSESDLVARAVEGEFRRLWNEPLVDELEAIASHPEFLRDLEECMTSFAASDAESARLIPHEI